MDIGGVSNVAEKAVSSGFPSGFVIPGRSVTSNVVLNGGASWNTKTPLRSVNHLNSPFNLGRISIGAESAAFPTFSGTVMGSENRTSKVVVGSIVRDGMI